MATQQGLLSVSMVDYLGTKVTHDVFVSLDDSQTLSSLLAIVGTYQGLLASINGLEELGTQLRINVTAAGNATPTTGVESEKTGLFQFSQNASRYIASLDVPGIAETKIVDGKIDLSDSDVVAWLAFVIGTRTGLNINSKYKNALLQNRSAAITFRKHRRGLNRTSTEAGV